MYNAIIFDLDGLLIDSEVISYQLYQDLIRPYEYAFSIEDYAQNYSGKTAIGNMSAIIKRFHLPITLDEGLSFIDQHEKEYFNKGVSLKEGAKELLEFLRENSYKIVLATSSTPTRAMIPLKQHQIEHYFDDMVFGTEVENGKPHPDIFLKACKKINVKPNEALVLEDSEAGIQASFSAGIPVICVPDMKEPIDKYKEMTTQIFSSLLKVMTYLKRNREYKMIALDVDGTLLNSHKQISKGTIDAIKKAIKKDKIVIFNTGRCPAELNEYFDILDEIQYLNCVSGALVYDRKNNHDIYSMPLDIQTVKQLIEIGLQEDDMIHLLTHKSIVQKDKVNKMETYQMGVYQEMYERVTDKWDDLYQQYIDDPFPVSKLNIYHVCEDARQRTRQRIIDSGLNVEMVNAESASLEISAKGIDKSIGLEKLCEHLKISLSQVIVVGDANNDIEALEKAGLAIVMENANENIKQLADILVSDNNHDGCVEAIDRYLLKV